MQVVSFHFVGWYNSKGLTISVWTQPIVWVNHVIYVSLCNEFNVFCNLFNDLTVYLLLLCSLVSNNWYQSQKVYLVGKLVGKKGSWFKWEQWEKKESLGLINLTTKTISYGRCKWRNIYTRRICTYSWAEEKKKLMTMKDEEWEVLDRKALGTIQLCLASLVAFNIQKKQQRV